MIAAVALTLHNFGFARQPIAGWLLQLEQRSGVPLLRVLTLSTWWAEISVLPLLMCPLHPQLVRLLTAVRRAD